MPKEIDQLESFFIRETANLLETYESIRSKDPRDSPLFDDSPDLEAELEIVKSAWKTLIAYAQIYNYHRFDTLNPDLEEFYNTKIR